MTQRVDTTDNARVALFCSNAIQVGRLLRAFRRQIPMFVFLLLVCAGCATQRYVEIRTKPYNPLSDSLNLWSRKGPSVSPRTMTLLRHYALLDLYKRNPDDCLAELQELAVDEKGAEKIFAISELAYTIGKRSESIGEEGKALDMYSVAVSNAYLYLFSPELDPSRNPYDPQFRGACDLYNGALESTLRLVNKQGNLRPGHSYRITTSLRHYDVQVVSRGSWHDEDFDEIKFCNDYQVKGLDSANVNYGVGVPMIAVRKAHHGATSEERFYPEGLAFPVTALLRVTSPTIRSTRETQHRHPCVLELHDPLGSTDITFNSRLVPLQSDLSTPLAYFLDNPKFREQTNSNIGLFDPRSSEKLRGVYMLEPYDPKRIPVLMVHGLWSSPLTWMPMFNDLRSFQELRRNYQFWFYQYPTGQPFWVSATQMRRDLFEMRQTLDPYNQHAVLDQMVLIGHSMGGLVSKMQTLESGEEFWHILSDEPFETVKGDEIERQRLAAALFFHPNQSVKRIVTIGTPHRGSDYSNDYTRWLARKIIRLPSDLTDMGRSLIRQNPDTFRNTELLTTTTSIDSLSPESPIFPTMLRSRRAPWVHYHNIVGVIERSQWFGTGDSQGSDGVVKLESAHIEDSESEILVQSKHQDIHRQPRAILEVRRILVDHLRDSARLPELLGVLDLPDSWKRAQHIPQIATDGQPIYSMPIHEQGSDTSDLSYAPYQNPNVFPGTLIAVGNRTPSESTENSANERSSFNTQPYIPLPYPEDCRKRFRMPSLLRR